MFEICFHILQTWTFYDIHINLASCGTLGGKQTVTATSKTQLARLNICSDWGKPPIKKKFERNLQGRNLRGLSVYHFKIQGQHPFQFSTKIINICYGQSF